MNLSSLHTYFMYYAYSRLSKKENCYTINDIPFKSQDLFNGGDPRGFAANIFSGPLLSQSLPHSEDEDRLDQPTSEVINDAVDTLSLSISDESVVITLNQVSDVLDLDVSDMTNATKSIIHNRLMLRTKQPSTNEIKIAVDKYCSKENTCNLTELEVFDYIMHRLKLDVDLTKVTKNIVHGRINDWRGVGRSIPVIIRDVSTTKIVRTYPSLQKCFEEEEGLGTSIALCLRRISNQHGYSYTKDEHRYFLQRKGQPKLSRQHMEAIFDGRERQVEKLHVTSQGVTVSQTYNNRNECFAQNQNHVCSTTNFSHGE